MISVTIKSQFFYYIKIFAYETKNGRGGQNMNFVEKNFFWKFFLQSKFSLEVRRSRKIQRILKILIFKDYFLTHATFLLTKYFSKFCHFFILLHKFQKFSKFLNFFQNFQNFFKIFPKFFRNLSKLIYKVNFLLEFAKMVQVYSNFWISGVFEVLFRARWN